MASSPNRSLVRQEPPEIRRKKQYSRDFAFAVISAFVALGWPEVGLISQESIWHPVIGWVLWAFGVAFVVHMLWIYWESIDRSLIWRIFHVTVMGVIFVGIASYSTYNNWKQHMASALEGDLIGAGEGLLPNAGLPAIQIGDSGTIFVPRPDMVGPQFQQFSDAEFRVEGGKKGPLVSTTVRDRSGNLLVDVKRNHWTVYQTCAEKNYTDLALEVKDCSGHVLLQLRFVAAAISTVQLQGEWWSTEGRGLRIMKSADGLHGEVLTLVPQSQSNDRLIQEIFQYPSKAHWGEFTRPR